MKDNYFFDYTWFLLGGTNCQSTQISSSPGARYYCYINFQFFYYLFFLILANIFWFVIPGWVLWFMNSSQTAIATLFGGSGDDATNGALDLSHLGDDAINFVLQFDVDRKAGY